MLVSTIDRASRLKLASYLIRLIQSIRMTVSSWLSTSTDSSVLSASTSCKLAWIKSTWSNLRLLTIVDGTVKVISLLATDWVWRTSLLSLFAQLCLCNCFWDGSWSLSWPKFRLMEVLCIIKEVCCHHHLIVSCIRSFPLLTYELREQMACIRRSCPNTTVVCWLWSLVVGSIWSSYFVHEVSSCLSHRWAELVSEAWCSSLIHWVCLVDSWKHVLDPWVVGWGDHKPILSWVHFIDW